jgi:hypothetical protein
MPLSEGRARLLVGSPGAALTSVSNGTEEAMSDDPLGGGDIAPTIEKSIVVTKPNALILLNWLESRHRRSLLNAARD